MRPSHRALSACSLLIALPLCAVLVGCGRDTAGQACTINEDCGAGQLCYQGACRDACNGLSACKRSGEQCLVQARVCLPSASTPPASQGGTDGGTTGTGTDGGGTEPGEEEEGQDGGTAPDGGASSAPITLRGGILGTPVQEMASPSFRLRGTFHPFGVGTNAATFRGVIESASFKVVPPVE